MPRRGSGHGMHFEKPKDIKRATNWLLRYLTPYKTTLVVVFFLVILYTLASLAGPYLLGIAIDTYIINKDLAGLARIVLIMAGAYLAHVVLQAFAGWIMARISQKALMQLRADLFSHLQKFSLRFFDHNPAGDLMSRLTNDITAINQAVSQNITALMADVLTLFGILIAMFALNVWLSLSALLVVPLMLGFTFLITKFTRRGFRELQKNLGNLNSTIEETISGQRVVKAFQRSQAAIETFRMDNQQAYEASRYANTYAFLLMPITMQIGNLFIIALASLGGWLALRDLVSVGMIATFISYSRQFLQPVRQLSELFNSLQSALAGAERVLDILDNTKDLEDGSSSQSMNGAKGHVKFDHVQFGYDSNEPVIKNMSFEALPGQTIALVGPTGAGKTTIINLLARFYDLDKGVITIDNVDISRIKLEDLRRLLGIVLQDTYLFSDTVMENIRYGRLDASDEECVEAAKMADADYFIRHLPEGYQTILSERASNLSLGQRQMLAISRAILANPRILILDEATSSVDTRTEARIQSALLRLMQGRTSFVIAHRLSTIREADSVLVINDGQIVEQGNHKELMDKKGFYQRLYISQFKGQII